MNFKRLNINNKNIMKQLFKIMPMVATAVLLAAGIILLAGCEKEKVKSLESKLVGTWVSCGFSVSDPYCGCSDSNFISKEIDTITFFTNHSIHDNFEYGWDNCNFKLIDDSTLFVQRKSDNWSRSINFKFTNNDSCLIMYNWRHRDILTNVYNVCLKKME